MKIKDVAPRMLEEIRNNISGFGFRLNKSKKCFTRSARGYKQIFTLLFHKSGENVTVEPDLDLKLHVIEDIYHKITTKDPEFFDGTSTLTNNLGRIMEYMDNGVEVNRGIPQLRYLIEDDEDIEVLIRVISEKFEKYVWPYFEANSSVERVDELLNRYPRELSIHHWLYPDRACIALIAAKLVGNPMYEDLVAIYTEELEGAVEDAKEEFSRLKVLLADY